MTRILAVPVIVGAMLAGGCATKKYVQQTSAPIQAKVDEVGQQTNRNATAIDEARKEIKSVDEKSEAGISAAKERAMTAENRANEAMTKANEAGTAAVDARSAADKASREIGALRTVVSNIDDYKLHGETTVPFQFGKHTLTDEAKEQLDRLVADKGNLKRFMISVQGFTDQIGTTEYNTALSQRRAASVVNYLVGKHDIPTYRIHMVGLGKEKLVDDAKTREARSKNRRVEVKVFSADQTSALSSSR